MRLYSEHIFSLFPEIAFYKAMGARLTDCPIKELAEAEPYDLQMICDFYDRKNESGRCISIWTDTWNTFFSSEGWFPKAG